MSGLNISNYLSQISGTNTPNNNMDILFGSLNKNNNNTSIFGGNSTNSSDLLGISYTDYASVKSGSYYKMMNKYYSNETAKPSKEDIEAFTKKQDITADKAAKVSADINDLFDMKFTEENKENISDKIKNFVSDYNNFVKNASSSDTSSIRQKSEWMNNMVSNYGELLSRVGITVNGDNTMSLNEESLSKSSISSLKDVFGSNANSFSNKVLYKAEQVYSLAKTYGSSATAYTSSGTYNRDYSSNYDTTT